MQSQAAAAVSQSVLTHYTAQVMRANGGRADLRSGFTKQCMFILTAYAWPRLNRIKTKNADWSDKRMNTSCLPASFLKYRCNMLTPCHNHVWIIISNRAHKSLGHFSFTITEERVHAERYFSVEHKRSIFEETLFRFLFNNIVTFYPTKSTFLIAMSLYFTILT